MQVDDCDASTLNREPPFRHRPNAGPLCDREPHPILDTTHSDLLEWMRNALQHCRVSRARPKSPRPPDERGATRESGSSARVESPGDFVATPARSRCTRASVPDRRQSPRYRISRHCRSGAFVPAGQPPTTTTDMSPRRCRPATPMHRAPSRARAVAEIVPGSIAVGTCTAFTPARSGALFNSGQSALSAEMRQPRRSPKSRSVGHCAVRQAGEEREPQTRSTATLCARSVDQRSSLRGSDEVSRTGLPG